MWVEVENVVYTNKKLFWVKDTSLIQDRDECIKYLKKRINLPYALPAVFGYDPIRSCIFVILVDDSFPNTKQGEKLPEEYI